MKRKTEGGVVMIISNRSAGLKKNEPRIGKILIRNLAHLSCQPQTESALHRSYNFSGNQSASFTCKEAGGQKEA